MMRIFSGVVDTLAIIAAVVIGSAACDSVFGGLIVAGGVTAYGCFCFWDGSTR